MDTGKGPDLILLAVFAYQNRLLDHLQYEYGIVAALQWYTSYLICRRQTVMAKGHQSINLNQHHYGTGFRLITIDRLKTNILALKVTEKIFWPD